MAAVFFRTDEATTGKAGLMFTDDEGRKSTPRFLLLLDLSTTTSQDCCFHPLCL
jgi:hypothetical protein